MSLNEGNQWNVSDGDISSWSCRALDESQAFTAGPCSTTQPTRAGVAGRGAAQQAASSDRRQLKKKNSDLLTHPETLARLQAEGRKGGGAGVEERARDDICLSAVTARGGKKKKSQTKEVQNKRPQTFFFFCGPQYSFRLSNLCINEVNRWSFQSKHNKQHCGNRPNGILLRRSWHSVSGAV